MKVSILSENFVSYNKTLNEGCNKATKYLSELREMNLDNLFEANNELNYEKFYETRQKIRSLTESIVDSNKFGALVFNTKNNAQFDLAKCTEAAVYYFVLKEFNDWRSAESDLDHVKNPESVLDAFLGTTVTIGSSNNYVDVSDTDVFHSSLKNAHDITDDVSRAANQVMKKSVDIEDKELLKECISKLSLAEKIIQLLG